MAILAHPDDESLGMGSVIARYAAEGVHVSIVTATRGESGRYLTHRDGPEHPGPERLGEMREAELRCAARVLGVEDVSLLGYRDGSLDRANPREAVGRIVEHVRRVRPQVVATFPPDGSYGHPDHIAISQLATAAMVAAADASYPAPGGAPPHTVSKLYYMVATPEEWNLYETVFKKLTSKVDGVERQSRPWADWEITTVIDTRRHWPTAWKAVSCHHSQMASYQGIESLTPEQHEALWGQRGFYRAYSLVNGGRQRESDCFEGLRDGASRRDGPDVADSAT
jgi:LmbE family N-acetylglucosaminyl deacetylase